MAKTTQVRTELTLDAGLTRTTLAGLRSDFDRLSATRDTTQRGMGFLGQTFATMAGVYIPQLIGRTDDFVRSLVDAAAEGESVDQSLGGLIASVQGIPWGAAIDQARGLGDEMDDISMRTRAATDDVEEAFRTLNVYGEASAAGLERSQHTVEQIARVGAVLNRSTADLGREYAMMLEGQVRMRGQFAQILQSTGTFGDNIKQAAGSWAKLTDEDRARILASGLDQVASRLARAEPTFANVTQQLKNAAGIAKEKLGEPLLEAIVPELERLVRWIDASRDEIEQYAKSMVGTVGRWVRDAADALQDGWRWVMSNQEEIKAAVVEAWAFAKSVIQFAVDHKSEIALAFAAKAVLFVGTFGGVVGAAKGAVTGTASMIQNVYRIGSGAVDVAKGTKAAAGIVSAVTGAGGGTVAVQSAAGAGGAAGAVKGAFGLTGIAGGAVALSAFSAAIAGVGLAAWQATKLMKETEGDATADAKARHEAMQRELRASEADFRQWSAAHEEYLDAMRRKTAAEAEQLGLSAQQAAQMVDTIREQHEANRALVSSAEAAAGDYSDLVAYAKSQGLEIGAFVGELGQITGGITAGFQGALDANNQGAQAYIAQLLVKSRGLQEAFIASAQLTSEGFAILADLVQQDASAFAEELKARSEAVAKQEKAKAGVPHIQMNGGQTFKIQQDFRDQDPDRVAIVFERDVAAAATRRVQSRFASSFGT